MIDTTAQNTLKNSLYNFIGFLLPIIIVIFVTPIIISYWGVKQYGVYIFLNTIITFLGLLDLGVSVANSKHIIEYHSKHEDDKLKNIIYSMNSVYLIMACAYLIICITIGIIIQTFFISRVGLGENNYLLLFSIVGFTGFIGAIFCNFTNIIFTIQRYDLNLKISMTFIVLSNLFMLLLVMHGYSLVSVMIMYMMLACMNALINYFVAKNIFPLMQLRYAWVKEEIMKNYKFGLSVAFNNLANSSLVHFDKLLVPIFLGNAQLTYYSVPGSIATKISSISGTFSSLLFPITVNLHTLNDQEKIKRVYARSIRLIMILSAAISLSIIFMADKILHFWLGTDFIKQSTIVLIVLVATNFFLALFSPISNLLMAMGKMKFLTTGSIIMAIVNIIALFLLLPRYGINGAAWAYLIATLFICYMLYYAEKNYFQINHFFEHLKLLAKLSLTAIPFFLIVKFLFYPMINSFASLVVFGPSSVVLFLLLYKIFGFLNKEDWNDFKMIFFSILKKLKIKKDYV